MEPEKPSNLVPFVIAALLVTFLATAVWFDSFTFKVAFSSVLGVVALVLYVGAIYNVGKK